MVRPDDPRIAKSGFALLRGQDREYYVRKYEIVLGRNNKSADLDVALGDNMNISRQHATIAYNFDLKVFELRVLGKNGVSVNSVLHTPSSPPVVLHSQDVLQIGDQRIYFLLPRQPYYSDGDQRSHSITRYSPEAEHSLNGAEDYEGSEEHGEHSEGDS